MTPEALCPEAMVTGQVPPEQVPAPDPFAGQPELLTYPELLPEPELPDPELLVDPELLPEPELLVNPELPVDPELLVNPELPVDPELLTNPEPLVDPALPIDPELPLIPELLPELPELLPEPGMPGSAEPPQAKARTAARERANALPVAFSIARPRGAIHVPCFRPASYDRDMLPVASQV
jgi:hypothetical protein